MARASQGLVVSPGIEITRSRMLPVRGMVLVEEGRRLEMDEIVARASLLGALHMINAAASLGLPPAELTNAVIVKEGDIVAAGQVLAQTKSLWGLFNNRVCSPIDGTMEAASKVTGQILLRAQPKPLNVSAYIPGIVSKVIPEIGAEITAEVSLVQGIFGIGGEIYGTLKTIQDKPGAVADEDSIDSGLKGSIVACGGRVTFRALKKMIAAGVRGVIAASARGSDLIELVGNDLNPASTGNEDAGITLILTEGFGDLSMADSTFKLLAQLDGAKVSANGATQIRAGVMRPEIVSLPLEQMKQAPKRGDQIRVGDRIRIVRGDAFGKNGRIRSIPDEPRTIESGVRALVFEVELDDNGVLVVVPRPNVELVSN